MRYEIEAATDIAMVGLWDSDLSSIVLGYKKWTRLLERDSVDGKLLYIDTGADGSYNICLVTTEEELKNFDLSVYQKVEGDFSINTKNGKLRIGGMEDYRSDNLQITDESSIVKLEPGTYEVIPYVLSNLEACGDKLVEKVGLKEVEYYESRSSGCLFAFSALILSIGVGYFVSWWLSLPFIFIGFLILNYYSRRNLADERYNKVRRVAETIDKSYPFLLFLMTASDELRVSRGHFYLDEVI